jgi:hypothetical protein
MVIDVTGLQNVPDIPDYGGGFADVYRGECNGRPVAIKVVRFYASDDAGLFLSVGTPFRTSRKNQLIPSLPEVLSRSCRMEAPTTPKYSAVARRDVGCDGRFRFALVSEWMGNGNIIEFTQEHVEVNRAQLVSYHVHCPPAQKPIWPIPKAGGCRARVGVPSQPQLHPRGLEGSQLSRFPFSNRPLTRFPRRIS